MGQHRQEMILRLACFFGAAAKFLLFRDVSSNLRGTDDGAVCQTDRGNSQGYVDETPVFRLPDRLVVLDRLPGPNPAQNKVFFRQPILWNDDGDGSADDFGRRVPEQSF